MREGIQYRVESIDWQIPEERVAEFAKKIEERQPKGTLDLLRFKEKLPIPTLEKLDRLTSKERQAFLQFYGKFSAAVSNLSTDDSWKYRAAFEFVKFVTINKESPKLISLLQRVLETAAIYIAVEKDSNTMGGSKYQHAVLEKLYSELVSRGRNHEANLLVNPFNLEKGTILYEIVPEAKSVNKVRIQEVGIQNIVLDGLKSKVVLGNEQELDIASINRRLSSGHNMMLRDGSNFFGNVNKGFAPELEQDHFQAGQKMRIKIWHPTRDHFYNIEVVGTNESELETKYGKAYLPFRRYLLKIQYKDLGNGEKRTVVLSQFDVEESEVRLPNK